MCVASNPVYLVQCLFLLHSLFLRVAHAAEASFDKKGLLEAVQLDTGCKIQKIRENQIVLHAVVEYLPAACKRVADCLLGMLQKVIKYPLEQIA